MAEQRENSCLDEWDVLKFLEYPRTGIGTSKLFADIYRNELKFVRELGMYFYYNGVVWVKDLNFVYARRLAKKFTQTAISTANKIEDDEIRNAAVKYYSKYTDFNQREKLIKDAQSVYVIEYSDFDKHKELYNCKNGTFNLETGELQPHSADDMLTQVSNVIYEKGAKCDRWEQFIDEVMEGDEQSKNLLQMISWYCLGGSTRLECFFMLYGATTRNGKGTFNSTMFKMHGDYAKALRPEALSIKSFYGSTDAPNEAIASLSGARYVSVSEPGEGLVLNSDLVKSLTGGDPITARFLHQHAFTYVPQFKIAINTNFLPKITDDTIFSSERLVLLNFSRHFDMETRDNRLKEKLLKPQSLSGVFNWCYEGHEMLEKAGAFHMPDKSKKLFDQYRGESDTTQQFIDECLISEEGAKTSVKKIYDKYKEWADDNGFSRCSKSTLKKRLEAKLHIEKYGNSDKVFDYSILDHPIPFD